jgi:hypothetical protein
MDVHGVFAQTCGFGNFDDVEILDEPEKEDCPLFLRKIVSGRPYGLNLFIHESLLFG